MRPLHSACRTSLAAMAMADGDVRAEAFYRRREYDLKRASAGIMPCLHMSVTSGRTSSGNVRSSMSKRHISFDHHAIFDRDREEYVHVVEDEMNPGQWTVARTGKRQFEQDFSVRPQVVRTPSSQEEARGILERAREQIGAVWEFRVLTNNCEHFVRQCWEPSQVPHSSQVRQGVAAIGGSGVIGAVGGAVPTGIAVGGASITTVTTVTTPTYFFGIAWGSTTATVVTTASLPVEAVVGIAAGAAAVGFLGLAAAAYGTREWALRDKATNSKLLPISIYNRSASPVTASVRNDDQTLRFPSLWDTHHSWRSTLGIGVQKCLVDAGMAEELNPPTLSDNNEMFVLAIKDPSRSITINQRVSRGDVIFVDADGSVQLQEVESEECGICLHRPPNVLLQPCGHWQYCDECVREVMNRNALCPSCRQPVERFDIDRRRARAAVLR